MAKLKATATGDAAPQIVNEPPRGPQPQPGETDAIAEIKRLGGRYIGTGWRATFSPDGNRIAFGKIDPKTGQTDPALAVVDLKTGKTKELAKIAKDPAWSPDGSKLAFDLRINFPSFAEVRMIETKALEGLRTEELPRDR